LGVLALLLVRCDAVEYQPTKTYVADKTPPDTAVVSLASDVDTVEAWGIAKFDLTVQLKGNDVIGANVFIGNRAVTSSLAGREVKVDTREVDSGTHDLTVRVFFKGGSGSIAAVNGGERSTATWEGTIVVDNTYPAPTQATSVEKEGEAVRITWEPVSADRIGFQGYRISKSKYKNSLLTRYRHMYDQAQVWDTLITDRTQTSLVDSMLSVGPVSYAVQVKASGHLAAAEEVFTYDLGAPKMLSVEHLEYGTARLTWEKIKFPAGFTSYSISRSADPDSYTWESVYTTDDVNDTTATLEGLPFGSQYAHVVSTSGRIGNQSATDRSSNHAWVRIGNEADFTINGAQYIRQLDAYLKMPRVRYSSESEMVLYDGKTKQEIRRAPVTTGVADFYGGFVVGGSAEGYHYSGRLVHVYDLQTLQKTRTIDLSGTIPEVLYIHRLWVSKNNILFANLSRDYRYDRQGAAFLVFDLDRKKVLAYENNYHPEDYWRHHPTSVIYNVAAGSGTYFVMSREADDDARFSLYRTTADSIERVLVDRDPPSRLQPYYADGFEDGEYIYTTRYTNGGYVSEVVRLADMQAVREIQHAPDYNIRRGYDHRSDQFYGIKRSEGSDTATLGIYDENGVVSHTIPVDESGYYRIVNGTVWTGRMHLDP
jgi:hypothetical protein